MGLVKVMNKINEITPTPALYDFHCHLEHSEYEKDLDEVIKRSVERGIRKVVLTGSNLENNIRAFELAKAYPDFFDVAIGTSPHDSSTLNKEQMEEELTFVKENIEKIVGIGEVGLDRHAFFDQTSWQNQQFIFEEYIELAVSKNLPVIVHSRKAEELVFDTLEKYDGVRVMLHCFMKPKMIERAVKNGWYVSIPTLKGKDIDKIIENIPINYLVTETDSPFLWNDPQTKMPLRNEPANVIQTYKQIEALKNLQINEVCNQIEKNYLNLFKKNSNIVLGEKSNDSKCK